MNAILQLEESEALAILVSGRTSILSLPPNDSGQFQTIKQALACTAESSVYVGVLPCRQGALADHFEL